VGTGWRLISMVKKGFALCVGVALWSLIIVNIVLVWLLGGPLGMFPSRTRSPHGPISAEIEFEANSSGRPASVIYGIAWTVLTGICAGSFGACLLTYVFVVGLLCLFRMAEAER
jgi:hypothetical protein